MVVAVSSPPIILHIIASVSGPSTLSVEQLAKNQNMHFGD